MSVREIDVADVRDTVEQLCLDANYELPENVVNALAAARAREVSPIGKQTISLLLENADVAATGRVPMCQDTGTVVLFAEIGQDDADLAAVEAALAMLSDPDRELLLLVCVEGIEARAAAGMLGISYDALRQRLARARKRLSDALESRHLPALVERSRSS